MSEEKPDLFKFLKEHGIELTLDRTNSTELELLAYDTLCHERKILALYKRKGEIADELAEFYGDSYKYSCDGKDFSKYNIINKEDLGNGSFEIDDKTDDNGVGGKLARQLQKELDELNAKIKELEK